MSSYIMDLRKIVGHRPLLQVGASVIVEDDKGRILLQLRSDNHCWGYAGGSVELDEVVEEAAKRELFEETGLIANKLSLFGVFSGKDTHYIYPNGDEVSNIDIVYICKDYSGELRCQAGEVNDLKFFENIKTQIKNISVLDELLLINSALEVANLKNVAEKYQLIKALWADLAPKNKLQQEQGEEEKAKLIKRRLRLFKDKNKTSKEYFKELITF